MKKKPRLKFYPGLAPIDLRTTGPKILDEQAKKFSDSGILIPLPLVRVEEYEK